MLSKLQALLKRTKEWKDIEYFHDDWKERVKLMSQFITSGSSVMDLGCGKMWLNEYLKQEITYIPVDYCKRSADTIVADFNKKQFPSVYVDNIFISGCLEYLNNPEWFIKKTAEYSRHKIILSYCILETHPKMDERKALNWKNHLKADYIIKQFQLSSFRLEHRTIHDNNTIFVFTKC